MRRPSRWNGARTSVSMVRSNSDLVGKKEMHLWLKLSEKIALGALRQSTVIYYETYLYSKMLLLQVLAASPSAPRTDKQERNMPRP